MSDGMSDGRDYGPFLSKHGPPIVSEHGKPVKEASMGLILEIVDMEKLATAFFDNLQIDNCEYGAVGVDGKRPFGNSDVEHDILKILGQKVEGRDESDPDGHPTCWSDGQRAYAAALYRNLPSYLRRKYGSKSKVQEPA